MKKYGKNYYLQYEAGFKSEDRNDHQRILELCHFKKNDRVLEVGCGYGILLQKIDCRYKLGVESNRYAVDFCRKKGLNVLLDANIEKRLNFKDKSFDYIIMNEVIEHLKSPVLALKECYRILADEGKIVITTTAKNFLNCNVDKSHLSEMTTNELEKMIEENNFVVDVHEVCGISFLNFLLEKFLFKTARFFRKKVKTQVLTVNKIQERFDHSFVNKFLFTFRSNYFKLGTTQLMIATKK